MNPVAAQMLQTIQIHPSHHPNPQRAHHKPRVISLKSNQTLAAASKKQQDEEGGIPIEDVKTLVKFKSRHNYIRVLQVSRRAEHALAGSRLLLLDAPGNIHSMSFLFQSSSITHAYYDVLATLPPILPPGPLGILGFGAGSAAKLILELYPQGGVIHGYELDPAVVSVGREYFGLSRVEQQHPGRLFVYIGNALNVKDGYAGLIVDLFSKGRVIPELQTPQTWEKLKGKLKKGGRIMVNVGGSCVEPEDKTRDGKLIMEETLEAIHKVFPGEVFVLSLGNEDSTVALAAGDGGLPHLDTWRMSLPKPLRFYVDMWRPFAAPS